MLGEKRVRMVCGAGGGVVDEGGWGWMVVLGTGIASLIQGVMVQAFGVLFLELRYRYNASAIEAAWVGALNMMSVGLFAPVASALVSRFGARIVGVTGGAMTGFGIIAMAFSPYLILVYFTFGLVAGMGICLTMSAGYILVTRYFEARRAFAMSLTGLGTGLGLLVFPTLLVKMYDEYGYLGASALLGAFCLNACVAGALFRMPRQRIMPPIYRRPMENGHLPSAEDQQGKAEKPPSYNDSPLDLPNQQNGIIKKKAIDDKEDVESSQVLLKNASNTQMRDGHDNFSKDKSCDPPFQKPHRPPMFDVSLLKDMNFMAMCFVYMVVSFAQGVATAFLPALAMGKGISLPKAAFLISIGGLAGIFGAIGIGMILDLRVLRPHRLHMFNLIVVILALCNLIIPLCQTYPGLGTSAAVRGILVATLMTQRPTVVADLVKGQLIPAAFGILTFAFAIGSLIGRPVGGALSDILGDYGTSFYISGTLCFMGSFVFLISKLCTRQKHQNHVPPTSK